MSAAANLMGLVTQLQNMECAISSIIMESSMKLASLTSASIFIAIETEDARRYTGSPHMMQAYLDRNMVPSGRDLQIDVDLNARIVHEHPPPYPPPQYLVSDDGAGPSTDMCVVPLPSAHQRPTKPFMKRHVGAAGDSTPSTPPKRAKNSDSPLVTPKVEDQKPEILGDDIASNTDSSSRTADNGALVSFPNDLATEVDDDDSDIEVLESVSFMEGDKIDDSFVNSPASASTSLMPANSADRRLDNPTFIPVDVSQNQMKIDALRSIENPLLAFQKGSVECRLLTSVFYDKGKEICQKCPFPSDLKHPQTKLFFERNFKEFLQYFPRLTSDTDLSKKAFIEYGNCKYTIDTFIRINAKAGFKVVAKKKNF